MAGTSAITHAAQVMAGQAGFLVQRGIATFSTTDATVAIPNVNIANIVSIALSFITQPATDEELYVSAAGTVTSNVMACTGSLTIGRVGASPTSGLSFSYIITGF